MGLIRGFIFFEPDRLWALDLTQPKTSSIRTDLAIYLVNVGSQLNTSPHVQKYTLELWTNVGGIIWISAYSVR
jgi:hypothetical protein